MHIPVSPYQLVHVYVHKSKFIADTCFRDRLDSPPGRSQMIHTPGSMSPGPNPVVGEVFHDAGFKAGLNCIHVV